MNRKKITYIQIVLILAIVITSLMMQSAFPKSVNWMPDGINTPIIAFEFLETNEEIQMLFGENSAIRSEIADAFNSGNRIDNIYLILYSVFIFTWLWLFFGNQTKARNLILILISVCLAFSDYFENQQMVAIASQIDKGDFTLELQLLHQYTWIKWGLLAILLFIISIKLSSIKYFGIIFQIVSVLTLIMGIVAYFDRSSITTFFTLGIMIQFLFLFSVTIKNQFFTKNA